LFETRDWREKQPKGIEIRQTKVRRKECSMAQPRATEIIFYL
jgi:hypothetical protein